MANIDVMNILAEELDKSSIAEMALVNAYHKIALSLMEKLAKPAVNAQVWELLLGTAFADSRLCALIGLPETATVQMPEQFLKDVLFLYEHWLKVACYFYDNYENLSFEDFQKFAPKDKILVLKNDLAQKYETCRQQFTAGQTIVTNKLDFGLMQKTFDWFKRVGLGEDLCRKYIAEINQALATLRSLQKQLMPGGVVKNPQ